MHKFERGVLWILVVAALLCAAGCGLMSPQQQSEALQVIDEMLKNGSITQAQWQAMREAILQASTTNWWAAAGQVVLGGVMGYLGVQARRGPVATPAEREMRKRAARPLPPNP